MVNNKSMQMNSNSANHASFGFFLLAIYTFLLLARPHEWPLFDIEFPLLRTFLILTFFSYLVSFRPKIWNVQCTLLILLLFSMLLSEIRAFRYFSDLSKLIEWINANIIPFILYFSLLSTIKRQNVIFFIFLSSSLIMVQHAYSQMQSPTGQGWAESVVYRYDGGGESVQARFVGSFNDPNDMGMFLVMNIPVAVYFLLTGKGLLTKAGALASVLMLCMGVYWSGSRGSLLGLLSVFFCLFYIKFGKIKAIILASISIPGVLVAMGTFRKISKDDESASQRLTAWYEGIQMLKHRPLFGFGKERFLEYHSKVAHNTYVTVMAELGIFGYVMWAMFMITALYMLLSVMKCNDVSPGHEEALKKEQVLSQYLLVALIGYAVTAFFISRSYIMVVYIFVAMTAAMYYRVGKITPLSLNGGIIRKIGGLAVISLGALYLVIRILLSL